MRVEGRVQGVFFRSSAKREADRLRLSGFARNEPDGSVTIEAEGDERDVTMFTEWAGMGPSRAVVSGITSEPVPPTGERDFHIG